MDRQLFERWAFDEGLDVAAFDDGDYRARATQLAWMGWSGAAAAASNYARRYAWVRLNAYIELDCDSPRQPGWTPDALDSAIDTASAATQPQGKEEPK